MTTHPHARAVLVIEPVELAESHQNPLTGGREQNCLLTAPPWNKPGLEQLVPVQAGTGRVRSSGSEQCVPFTGFVPFGKPLVVEDGRERSSRAAIGAGAGPRSSYRCPSVTFHAREPSSCCARGDSRPVSRMLREGAFKSSRLANRATRSVHDR